MSDAEHNIESQPVDENLNKDATEPISEVKDDELGPKEQKTEETVPNKESTSPPIPSTDNGKPPKAGEEDTKEEKEEEVAAVLVVPPDGGWGWVVVAASFVCNFFVDGIIFNYGIFQERISEAMQVGTSETALVGSLLSGFYLLSGPFVSALANKYGFRKVTVCGGMIASSGFVAASFVDSIIYMYIFYGIVAGIGLGLIYSPSILIVGFYFEKWRAIATGIAVCGSGIGMLVLAPIMTELLVTVDWRWTVRIQGMLILICAICGLLFRPLTPVEVCVQSDFEENQKRTKIRSKRDHPTAAELLLLGKSTQSLTPSVILTRVAALSGQTKTQSVPMIALRKRTASENSESRSRRGTVTECMVAGRRGTITKVEDLQPINRPLYRDDIFFTGSLRRLPDYNSSQRDFMGYTLSVTRLPTTKDLLEEEEFKWCPEAVTRALGTLFDTSLLKSPSFILLSASGFLALMGIFTPFNYIIDRANQGGMDPTATAWLLSAIGVTNTVGRVICGIAPSIPGINALLLNNIALTVGGIATMASSMYITPQYQFTYCGIFGFTLACFGSLRSIIVVDLLGIDKLTNAFGLLLLFQGFATVLGTPFTGFIKEQTGTYEWSFIVAGGFILVSAILCYPLNALSKWEMRKEKENDETFF